MTTTDIQQRLRKAAKSYSTLAQVPMKHTLEWKAAAEIARLTSEVERLTEAGTVVTERLLERVGQSRKADVLAEAAENLTINLAALILSSDDDLDIELGEIAAALTAWKDGK